jgi:hypothetical protein
MTIPLDMKYAGIVYLPNPICETGTPTAFRYAEIIVQCLQTILVLAMGSVEIDQNSSNYNYNNSNGNSKRMTHVIGPKSAKKPVEMVWWCC